MRLQFSYTNFGIILIFILNVPYQRWLVYALFFWVVSTAIFLRKQVLGITCFRYSIKDAPTRSLTAVPPALRSWGFSKRHGTAWQSYDLNCWGFSQYLHFPLNLVLSRLFVDLLTTSKPIADRCLTKPSSKISEKFCFVPYSRLHVFVGYRIGDGRS